MVSADMQSLKLETPRLLLRPPRMEDFDEELDLVHQQDDLLTQWNRVGSGGEME